MAKRSGNHDVIGRQMTKRTIADAVLMVAGVAVVLTLAGCGKGPSGEDIAAATATDERLMALQTSILGSSVEQSAGGYLGNYALDAPVKECMAAQGLPYKIEYLDTAIGEASSSLGDTWTEPLNDDSTVINAQVAAEQAETENKLMAPLPDDAIERTPEYSNALSVCEKESGNYEMEAAPPGAISLATDLDFLLNSVESEVGSLRPYNECMAESGFDVTQDQFQGVDGLRKILDEEAPPTGQIPEPGKEGGEAWQEYQELSSAAADADLSCRLSQHVEAMNDVATALDNFEAANAEEIDEIRSGWERIVQEATAKGWLDKSARYDISP